MIDGSEKCNGWLNLGLHSAHVIERRSNSYVLFKKRKYLGSHFVQKAPRKSLKRSYCAPTSQFLEYTLARQSSRIQGTVAEIVHLSQVAYETLRFGCAWLS